MAFCLSLRSHELPSRITDLPTCSRQTTHNLIGEGPRGGSPVEIGWPGLRYSGHRAVLINLAEIVANFAVSFAQVVDFVPCDETLKQQARERYKAYRLAGIQITTANAVTETP